MGSGPNRNIAEGLLRKELKSDITARFELGEVLPPTAGGLLGVLTNCTIEFADSGQGIELMRLLTPMSQNAMVSVKGRLGGCRGKGVGKI